LLTRGYRFGWALERRMGMAIPADELAVLDANSNHPYTCRCKNCCRWWVLMGPDGGEDGNYGPFSRDEVLAEAKEWGKPTEMLT
jgi:hypothetical protein